MQAKVFPGLRKPMILGIPWLRKANRQINWTQETAVVKKGRDWVSLPLARRKDDIEDVNMVSAKQMSRLLRKGTERAFLGFVRKVEDSAECNMVEAGVKSDLESHL